MHLILELAATLYNAENFNDIGRITVTILHKLSKDISFGCKIGIYDKEIDQYKIYFDSAMVDPTTIANEELYKNMLITCKFNEIKYFSRIVANTKKRLVVQDNHGEFAAGIHSEQKNMARHCMLWEPLVYNDEFLGIISIGCKPVNSITEELIEIVEGIGKITSIKVYELLTARQLAKSEETSKALLNALNEISLLINKNGDLLVVNEAACHFLKAERAALVEKSIFHLIENKLNIIKKEQIEFVINSGNSHYSEINDNNNYYENRIIPIKDKNGIVIRIAIFINNITIRKINEEYEKKRKEQILRHQSVLLELTKIDTADINESLNKILEKDAGVLDSERVSFWMFSETHNSVSCESIYLKDEAKYEKGKMITESEYPLYFKLLEENRIIIIDSNFNYSKIDIEYSKYLSKNNIKSVLVIPLRREGKLIGILSHEKLYSEKIWTNEEKEFAASITDLIVIKLETHQRKMTEEALQKSDNELRVLFSALTELIIIFDIDGTYLKLPNENSNIMNLPPSERIGKKVHDIFPKELADLFLESIKTTLATKSVTSIEYKFELEGKVTEWDTRISPLSENSVLWIARDVTEKKKSEREHLRLQNLESLGILAGGIAHDFNNILTSIMGQASVIQIRTMEENTRNSISILLDATKRAVGLTQQLLTFAKGGVPQKSIISIRKVIQEVARFALSGSNVEAIFNFNDYMNIEADQGQISQVIQNLLINAKQAMPEGGRITIFTQDTQDDDEKPFARIKIQDTGVGITKDNLNKIFDPYFSTKQSGSGLGLSVCHSIIKRHGGNIFVESVPGSGTTFELLLPACRNEMIINKSKQEIVEKKFKILIMDDEASIRLVFREILEELGHEVVESVEGNEAIEIYEKALVSKQPFDIIFLDLTIKGGLGGQDTVKKLKSITPDLKVVVSSGYADSAVSNFREDGFDGKLNKPYTIDEVNNLIYQVMI